ncbi:MAG: hypothetical protein JRH19_00240 [Deltaproteobacteria bacterium]|nr:hypothetical protein [Deltaproteobacteria bacterium]
MPASRLLRGWALLFFWSALGAPGAAGASDSKGLERRSERGPVEVLVRLQPEAPVIGDSLTLEIEALAEEGVELLMPEFAEALDRFLVLDFAPREELAEDGRTRSVQRYTLQPPMSGALSIPPLLVEFVDRRPGSRPAPEGADAYELLTERIDFEVASVLPEGALPDLRPMPGELALLGRGAFPLWALVLGALGLFVVAAPFAFRYWRQLREQRLRQTAYQAAVAELEALLYAGRPGPEQLEKFYVELSWIIRRYLENRFGLRSPELTTEEFLSVASTSPDLSAQHRSMLGGFLERADLVKFAGFVPDAEQVEQSIGAARSFLEETRRAGDEDDRSSASSVAVAGEGLS